MIVPVWEDQGTPEKNMEIQQSAVPRTRYIRMRVDSPRLGTLDLIRDLLINNGVPLDADLGFSQWNIPDTTWYVHATWSED